MSTMIYRNGIGNQAAYQVAAIPFITGSTTLSPGTEHKIPFPAITRSITVVSKAGADIDVHFNPAADGNVIGGLHFVTLDTAQASVTFNVKCKEIYISNNDVTTGSYQLFAEITTIQNSEMYILTGSGLTD